MVMTYKITPTADSTQLVARPLNPLQKEFNVPDVPTAVFRGRGDLAGVELFHELPDTGVSLGSKLLDDRHHRPCKDIGFCSMTLIQFFEIRVAEFDAFGLGCCKSFFRAFADAIPFKLSKHRQHLNHHLVGVRVITANKIDFAFHQAGDEINIPREPVKLCDQQRCFLAATLLGTIEQTSKMFHRIV